MQWEFKDMPWLPYYSIAVFGKAGLLLRPDIWEKTVSPCLFMGFLRRWRIYSAITDGF